ncbi:hypothetical protein [Methanococcoides sp.]|uniref:hypothetical protein n=1 Tax=Methanococcoides sp. TaxID=1966350 RepID=UPI00272E7F52|nr:hypothetical protein [Methanococcoides sp.]
MLYHIEVYFYWGLFWGAGLSENTLIFVYNADSGLINEMKDYVHKIVSPSTYGCNLCAITYGNTGIKAEWKSFVDDLGIPVKFLHKDEFYEKYGEKESSFPCAYLENSNKLDLFISSDEINNCSTLEELMSLVTLKVNELLGN